jgi:hypothetical protein
LCLFYRHQYCYANTIRLWSTFRQFFCKQTIVLIFPQTGSFIRVRQMIEASQEKRKEAIYDVLFQYQLRYIYYICSCSIMLLVESSKWEHWNHHFCGYVSFSIGPQCQFLDVMGSRPSPFDKCTVCRISLLFSTFYRIFNKS